MDKLIIPVYIFENETEYKHIFELFKSIFRKLCRKNYNNYLTKKYP